MDAALLIPLPLTGSQAFYGIVKTIFQAFFDAGYMVENITPDDEPVELGGMTFTRSGNGFKAQYASSQSGSGVDAAYQDDSAGALQFVFDADSGRLMMASIPKQGSMRSPVDISLGKDLGPTEAMAKACAVHAAFQTILQERYSATSLEEIRIHGEQPNSNLIKGLFKESEKAAAHGTAAPDAIKMDDLVWMAGADLSVTKIESAGQKQNGLPVNTVGSFCLIDPSQPDDPVFLNDIEGQITGKNFCLEVIDPDDPTSLARLEAVPEKTPLLDAGRMMEKHALKNGKKRLSRVCAVARAHEVSSEIDDRSGQQVNKAQEAARKLLGPNKADALDREAKDKRAARAQAANNQKPADPITYRQPATKMPSNGLN